MRNWTTEDLTKAAVMSAFVFIATFVPKIPIPLGYAHLGDAAIFIVVMFFGRRVGLTSAAIGSALADLIGGFPIWVGPTIIIKFLMAEIFARISGDYSNKFKVLAGMVMACLFMTAGYTIFGAIFYGGLQVGLTSTPGLLVKSVVNIIAAALIGVALKNRIRY